MDTNNFHHLVINKNRGWRGLAEVIVRSAECRDLLTMTFSFSPKMWIDLIVHNKIVVQDINNYYVITFEDTRDELPKPSQQRSVLIKNAVLRIHKVNTYAKDDWTSAEAGDWNTILHFVKNKNNHTTSDWNCIRITSSTKNIRAMLKTLFGKERYKMRNSYESVIIFRGDLTKEQYKYKVDKYLDTISSLSKDTKITKIDRLGERKLAYEIKSYKTGWYVLFQFKTEAENIMELERLFRIDDDIMKFITVKLDEMEIEEDERKKAEMEESEDDAIVESEQKPKIIDYWDVAFGLED